MLSKKAALFTFDTNFSPQAFQDLESQYFFSMEFLEAAHYRPPRVLPVVKQVFSPQATISSSSIGADGQTWNLRYESGFSLFFVFFAILHSLVIWTPTSRHTSCCCKTWSHSNCFDGISPERGFPSSD